MEKDKEWRIHKICKKCRYRKAIGPFITISTDWSNTCCTYALETEDVPEREELTDDYCPYFENREKHITKRMQTAIDRGEKG